MEQVSAASSTNSKSWESLPLKILVQIVSYLSIFDRFQAAFTCKSWNQVLNYPQLWRKIVCVFGSKIPTNEGIYCEGIRAVLILKHCSLWIQSITLLWLPDDDKELLAIYDLETLLKSLLKLAVLPQLKELHLIGGDQPFHEDDSQGDLMPTMARFLLLQQQLEIFEIQWQLSFLKAAILFDALAISCYDSLKILRMENAIRHEDVSSSPQVLGKCLSECRNLREVHMSYLDAEEEIINSLAANCSKTLKILKLLVAVDIPEIHRISSNVWKQTKLMAPDLKVHFDVEDFSRPLDHLEDFIPRDVPLWCLSYKGISFRKNHFKYLENFSETLEVLTLQFFCGNQPEEVDEAILDLVKSSPNLSSLNIEGICSIHIIQAFVNLGKKGRRNQGKTAVDWFHSILNGVSLFFSSISQPWMTTVRDLHIQFKLYGLSHEDILKLQEQKLI